MLRVFSIGVFSIGVFIMDYHPPVAMPRVQDGLLAS